MKWFPSLVLLLFASAVFGDVELFMAPNGSSDLCGTFESPCSTLKSLLMQTSESEHKVVTVNVAPGYYESSGNTNLALPAYDIVIRNTDVINDAIFDCEFSPFALKAYSSLELVGITIANCTDTAIDFRPSEEFQALQLTSVMISSCGSGIQSTNGNIDVKNSKFFAISEFSSKESSGCGIFAQGSKIDQITIQHTYFEDITKHSMYIDVPVSEIQILNTDFLMTSGIVINSGSDCVGRVSSCEIFAFTPGAGQSTALEITAGDWVIDNVVTTSAVKGSCDIGVHLNEVRSAVIDNSQFYLGDVSLRATNSNFHLIESVISSVGDGVHVHSTDPEVTNSVKLEGLQFESGKNSLLVNGVVPASADNFNYIDIKDCDFGVTTVQVSVPSIGRMRDCNFDGCAGRAVSITADGKWEFNSITVQQSQGFEFISAGVSADISDSSFLHNSGDQGGAIYFDGEKMRLENCLFEDNTAKNNGGAIYLAANSECSLDDVTFADNTADHGAAVYCDHESTYSNVYGNDIELHNNQNKKGLRDIPCLPVSSSQSSSTSHSLMLYITISSVVAISTITALFGSLLVCLWHKKKTEKTNSLEQTYNALPQVVVTTL